jgi:hypothetical protein
VVRVRRSPTIRRSNASCATARPPGWNDVPDVDPRRVATRRSRATELSNIPFAALENGYLEKGSPSAWCGQGGRSSSIPRQLDADSYIALSLLKTGMTTPQWEKVCREEEQISATRFRQLKKTLVTSGKAPQLSDKTWVNHS